MKTKSKPNRFSKQASSRCTNVIVWCALFVFVAIYAFGFAYLYFSQVSTSKVGSFANEIPRPSLSKSTSISKPLNTPSFNDSDPKLLINDPSIGFEFIPLRYPWGHIYSHRILCLIITLWPDRKEKMDVISNTYGRGCTKLMWVVDEASNPPSSYAGHDMLIIHLRRIQGIVIKERNIWEKVHTMWSTISTSPLVEQFDWFIKADDDTFIMSENMHGFLQYYDPEYPHYLGHAIRSRWQYENVIFNSGVCYVLSRTTIKKIGPYLKNLPTLDAQVGRSHCVDRDGAGEDPTTGICLLGVGIRPGNTLDYEMRERFLIFRPDDHIKIIRENTWYWTLKPHNVKVGQDCCSPYIVCAHNYKHINDVKFHYPKLQEKYNQPKNWSMIPLPPKPRTFLYDKEKKNFKTDEYYNVEDPPKGQRIYKGKGKEWQCWKCNIGNARDVFWTKIWDGDKT